MVWLGVIAAALAEDLAVDKIMNRSSKPNFSTHSLGLSSYLGNLEKPFAYEAEALYNSTNPYKLQFDHQLFSRPNSPIVSGLITSPFTKSRFHPVLGKMTAHNGVDYGAPIGTPVLAVADGKVSFLGSNLLAGHMIKITHGPGQESRYLHLSGYSPGARLGQHVHAGETIGYVGQSGLATGPHLHFEVWLDGKPVSPDAQQLSKLARSASNMWRNYHLSVRRALTYVDPMPKSNSLVVNPG